MGLQVYGLLLSGRPCVRITSGTPAQNQARKVYEPSGLGFCFSMEDSRYNVHTSLAPAWGRLSAPRLCSFWGRAARSPPV